MSSTTSSTRTLAAAQLIYANVEADESPRNVRGFQTVFWTQDRLDANEIKSEIEPRLKLLERAEPETETVFFRTSRGRFVLGRITPLLNERDSLGRKKVMFAHALILDEADFRRWNYNPFPLFDGFHFYSRLEDVRRETGTNHGALAAAELCPPTGEDVPVEGGLARELDRETMLTLLRLAVRSQQRDGARVMVGCFGPAKPMLDMLRKLFQMLPAEIRAHCSFDTLFVDAVGQSKGNGQLSWAIGLTRGSGFRDSRCIQFDPHRGRFLVSPVLKPDETLFERWLTSLASREDWQVCLDELAIAFEVSSALERQTRMRPDIASHAPFVSQYLDAVRPQIEALVRQKLGDHGIGPCLTNRLISPVYRLVHSTGNMALLVGPLDLRLMAEWLVEEFLQPGATKPAKDELVELFELVKETGNQHQPVVLLDALYSYWNGEDHLYRLAKAVGMLDEEGYCRLAQWCLAREQLSIEWQAVLSAQDDLLFGPVVAGSTSSKGRKLIAALLGGTEEELTELPQKSPVFGSAPIPRTRIIFKEATSGMVHKGARLCQVLAASSTADTPPPLEVATFQPATSPPVATIGTMPPLAPQGAETAPPPADQQAQWYSSAKEYRDECQWRELGKVVGKLSPENYRKFAKWSMSSEEVPVDWRVVYSKDGQLRFGPMLVAARSTPDLRSMMAALLGASDFCKPELEKSRARHHWPILIELLTDRSRRRERS